MAIGKLTFLAIAIGMALAVAVPGQPVPAEAASHIPAAKKQKQPLQAQPRKRSNFRAARPDEYPRIFGCDGIEPYPACLEGEGYAVPKRRWRR